MRFFTILTLLVFFGTPSFAATWNCTSAARNGKDSSAIGKGCSTSRSQSEAEAIGECKEYGANAGKVCYIVECHPDREYCMQESQ